MHEACGSQHCSRCCCIGSLTIGTVQKKHKDRSPEESCEHGSLAQWNNPTGKVGNHFSCTAVEPCHDIIRKIREHGQNHCRIMLFLHCAEGLCHHGDAHKHQNRCDDGHGDHFG